MRNATSRELKYQARVLLDGKYGRMAFLTFLMAVFDLGLNYLIESAFPSTDGVFNLVFYIAATILCNMVYYILLAGLMRIYLHLCRGEEFRISDLFSAFSERPEQIALYSVVQFVLQNALSVAADRCFDAIRSLKQIPAMLLLLAVIGLVVLVLQLCLALVLFLFCDAPQKTAFQVIKESLSMMRGNKWRYFRLLLSFVGVLLLCVLSFGIGFLFVRPYLYVTQALFYLDLIGESAQHAGAGAYA